MPTRHCAHRTRRRWVGISRSEVVAELGDAATVTAIGVVANFQMMNRALDAAGVPARPDPSVSEALGLDPDEFGGAHGAA